MPFIKTAYLGSPGASALAKGDYINHFHVIRGTVTGSGILRTTLYTLDDARSEILPNYTMTANAEYPMSLLTNLMSPRCAVRINTADIDEIFRISRLVVYSRPVFAEIPR